MFKKKQPKRTTEEELVDFRKRRDDLKFWMENGGPDVRTSQDATKLTEYEAAIAELEQRLETELRNPPKEVWFRKMFR